MEIDASRMADAVWKPQKPFEHQHLALNLLGCKNSGLAVHAPEAAHVKQARLGTSVLGIP